MRYAPNEANRDDGKDYHFTRNRSVYPCASINEKQRGQNNMSLLKRLFKGEKKLVTLEKFNPDNLPRKQKVDYILELIESFEGTPLSYERFRTLLNTNTFSDKKKFSRMTYHHISLLSSHTRQYKELYGRKTVERPYGNAIITIDNENFRASVYDESIWFFYEKIESDTPSAFENENKATTRTSSNDFKTYKKREVKKVLLNGNKLLVVFEKMFNSVDVYLFDLNI